VIAVGTALSTLALYAALTTWTDSTVPAADALTTSLSLAAQLMMGRKWLGSWAVWITVDALFVVLYINQGLWLTSVLYAGFIPLCVRGVYEWRRDMAKRGVEPIAASSGNDLGGAGTATGAVAAETVHP
jgi:nicotinamide mononucleotide transporter